MIEVPCSGNAYHMADFWYRTEGPGIKYNLQKNAGIITREQYYNQWEDEFHCILVFEQQRFSPVKMIFKDEHYATMFAMRWA